MCTDRRDEDHFFLRAKGAHVFLRLLLPTYSLLRFFPTFFLGVKGQEWIWLMYPLIPPSLIFSFSFGGGDMEFLRFGHG